MKTYRNPIFVPLLLLAVFTEWGTVGCSLGPSTARYVINDTDKMVGMEVTYREGSPEYSHPAVLPPEQIEKILQHLEVHPSSLLDRILGGSSTTQEAFSEKQRRFFSDNLAKAFEQATPLETVTFYSSMPRGNGIWEITSGGMYIERHELHLVLPNYHYTISATTSPQISKADPLRPLGEPLHSLKSVDPVRQLTHHRAIELWAPHIPHFVLSLQDLANIPSSPSSSFKQPSSALEPAYEPIGQRLKNLEELRKEGLVTEKEYQQKRQEILEQL